MTACLKRLGFQHAYGIDHVIVENCVINPLLADLASPAGRELALFWLSNPLLSAVFAAPVCGTCSRARDIPLLDEHGNQLPAPMPLRSASFPDGIPGLSGKDLRRVRQANLTYDCLADMALLCHSRGVLILIENPHRSWFWWTTPFRRFEHAVPHRTTFHHCQFGGRRMKATTIACSQNCLQPLDRSCPGPSCSQFHLPWGKDASGQFNTKSEAAYPPELAATIAKVIQQHLISAGWTPPSNNPSDASLLAACRAVAGHQPKASKFPALVPEHATVLLLRGPAESLRAAPCSPMQRLDEPWPVPKDCHSTVRAVPAGSQLLRPPCRLRWETKTMKTISHLLGTLSKPGECHTPPRPLCWQQRKQVILSCLKPPCPTT